MIHPNGESPLVMAALARDLTNLKLLVESGANVNSQTPLGRSPLIVSAELGNIDMVKYLLKNGAEVDQVNVVKATPLFASSAAGQTDVVKHLLECKADPNLNYSGFTSLFMAALHGHAPAAQVFANRNIPDLNGGHVLFWEF